MRYGFQASSTNKPFPLQVLHSFNITSFKHLEGIPAAKLFVVGECVDEEYYSEAAITNSEKRTFERKRGVNFYSMFNWNYRYSVDDCADYYNCGTGKDGMFL